MKPTRKQSLCLFFHVHQPYRLKTYRFFNIGVDHHYYDEVRNKHILKRVVHNSYLPANDLLLYLIRKYGDSLKISFGISGMALEQFETYTPWLIDSFRKLYLTGNVEFVAEPYAYSLAMLGHTDEYTRQLRQHEITLQRLFGCKPKTLMLTNMIFSNELASFAQQAGIKTMLTGGSSRVLEWRSPNYVYSGFSYPDVNLLLRNDSLSDDICFNFSERDWCEWPLTAGKFTSWLDAMDCREEVVNLFLDYAALGEYQHIKTGIFSFFEAFIKETILAKKRVFRTVSELSENTKPIGSLDVGDVICWADQEKTLSAWLGNEIQQDAFQCLYSVADKMKHCTDEALLNDWNRLQTCDHFYYMSTKPTSDIHSLKLFSPYSSPYEAFVNYMNVLSDFIIRVNESANRPPVREFQAVSDDNYETFADFQLTTF